MNITLMILYIAMGRLSYAYWLLKMAGERLLNKKKIKQSYHVVNYFHLRWNKGVYSFGMVFQISQIKPEENRV